MKMPSITPPISHHGISAKQIIFGEKYVHDLARSLWEISGRGYTYINKKVILDKIN